MDLTSSALPLFDLPEIYPKIDVGKPYMLKCLLCDSDIMKEIIIISRVILESMNATDISDIFCHRSKEVFQFEKDHSTNLCQKEQSIYLDIGSFKLPFLELENMIILFDGDVVHCGCCFSWLGLRYSNGNSSMCFWSDTVKILSSDPKQLNKISELILYKTIATTLVECLFSVCNIMLICKINAQEERRLLMTVMDRNLRIWEYCNTESSFIKVPYMKVLFEEAKHDQWNENSIHKSVLVSKPTFVNSLKLLHLHRNEISFSTVNVAYLPVLKDFN